MKTILCTVVFCFIAVLSVRSDEPKQKEEMHCVVISYRKPVEGFDVTVFWRPREQIAGFLIGPAILEFRHKDPSKSFAVTNNRFGLRNSEDWIKTATIKDGYYVKTSQPRFVLDFVEPEVVDQLPETSFFFVDLNFDGRKELVMTEIANGQRYRHAYQVLDIDSIGNCKPATITNQEPFASLDSGSRIDFKNRTIRLFNSGGALINESLLYQFDKTLDRYILVKREQSPAGDSQ